MTISSARTNAGRPSAAVRGRRAGEECCDDVPAGFTCNVDWPYVYECFEGRCRSRGCEDAGECEAYADLADSVLIGCEAL